MGCCAVRAFLVISSLRPSKPIITTAVSSSSSKCGRSSPQTRRLRSQSETAPSAVICSGGLACTLLRTARLCIFLFPVAIPSQRLTRTYNHSRAFLPKNAAFLLFPLGTPLAAFLAPQEPQHAGSLAFSSPPAFVGRGDHTLR